MNTDHISVNTQSSIRIEGSRVLYFDPFKITAASGDADLIFVTHPHYDHFDPESIANIWVVLLSWYFFREPVTKKKVFGNILILIGIAVFYLDWAGISDSLAFLNTDWGTLISNMF